jgi:DNA polymerase-3 subunit gamma/tau
MLGTVGDEHLFALLDALMAQDIHGMMAVASLMDARSLSFDSGLQELATLFHRIALIQFAPDAILDEAERQRLAPYAAAFDSEFLQLCYQIAIHGRDELGLAPDEYAGFVMTLLRLHAFRPERAGQARQPAAAPVRPAASVRPLAPAPVAHVAPVAPVVAAVPPAPTIAAPAVSAPVGDDDWHGLVARLTLSGMSKQLAQHCEFFQRNETQITLRLSPVHKHLLGKVQEDKLQSELQNFYGKPLRLVIDVAATATETPAERHKNVQRERQEKAIASIEQDPFVRDVVDLFDASIDESTIKPL